MATLAANVKTLGMIFNAFMADAMALPDPGGCTGKTLADSIVMTITGDTPKDGPAAQRLARRHGSATTTSCT